MPSFNFKERLDSFKSFDWRGLRRLASPQAFNDFSLFLDKLPQHAGQTMLVIAGITWAAAGVVGLYVTIQMGKLTELRAELQKADALKPSVPVIKEAPVNTKELAEYIDSIAKMYDRLTIKANGSSVSILANETSAFGEFREAINHIQNGGSGWRVSIDRLCVGRECERQPLAVSLKISKVSVEKPQ